jgi:hypothetical protein
MWVGYLITSEDRLISGEFSKLLNSLPQSDVRLVVGCRGFDPSRLLPEVKDGLQLPLDTSLSDARNNLLDSFPYEDNDLVFFPDDDCWLPSSALDVATHWLQSSDFVIGVVDVEGGESASLGEVYGIHEHLALKKAASAAIFVRGKAMSGFRFSTSLGLGSKFKAGEDLDLILYMINQGKSGLWSADLRIGHPKKNRSMEYFPGSIAALSMNSRKRPAFLLLALRRWIHGFVYFVERRLSGKSLLLGFQAFFVKRH